MSLLDSLRKLAHGPGESIGNQRGGTPIRMNDILEATKDIEAQEIDPSEWEWLLKKKIWGKERTLSPLEVLEYINTGDTKGYDKEQLDRDVKQILEADLSYPVLIAENKKHMYDGAHRLYKSVLTGEKLLGKYIPDSVWEEIKQKSLYNLQDLENKRKVLTQVKALLDQYPEYITVVPGASISRTKQTGLIRDLREALKRYELERGEDPDHDWNKEASSRYVSVKLFATNGDVTFRCKVVDTPSSMARGLMDVEHLEPDEGMLFIYPWPVTDGFWMKDTVLPLTVIWFNKHGEYVDHANMTPMSTDIYRPRGEYSYALEILTSVAGTLMLAEGCRIVIRI